MEAKNESFTPLTVEGDIPYIDGQMDVLPRNDTETSANDKENGQNKTKVPDDDTTTYNPGILAMCGKWSFPWLLTISMVQLGIYLNKLYQDGAAVAVYFDGRDINFCIVSALCLFIPAVIYIIYMVSVYVKDQEEAEAKEVGTRVVHGMLLVPWQIKGRVEVLHFSAQRVCQRRELSQEELEEKSNLERQAAVLEFFEEFYAGFIQLLLQLYIIIISLDRNIESKALPGEMIASALTLLSMMAAVRRRDDGILTGILSVVGWSAIMVSRCVAISLATTVIHGWMALICILHGLLMSGWLCIIAVGSYQQERSSFTKKRKLALFFLIFTVFGLPSLTYWPIMFQLKNNKRPLIFLFILLMENILFFGLWYSMRDSDKWASHHHVLVSVMAIGYVMGAMFLLFYMLCKPKYTDQVVYHDMKARNSDNFGMYFEFCDMAFRLPRTESVELKLQRIRKQNAAI